MLKFAALIFSILVLNVLLAPYTKVEESFNLQAIHDLLYQTPYDHLEFPGVVPRTFIGPLLVFPLLLPFKFLEKQYLQTLARIALSLYVSIAYWFLLESIRRRYSKRTAMHFTLFTVTQFHFIFWASRTLPNVFALIFFVFIFGCFLRSDSFDKYQILMISSSAFVVVCFRSELFGLVSMILLIGLYKGNYSIKQLLLCGIISSIVSIILTVSVDSYFWGYWVWPELAVFQFNGIENKSIEWGVSPFHYYFTRLLPKISPLSLLYCLKKPNMYHALVFGHLLILSFIQHKEWRFIIYVLPIMNLNASIGKKHPLIYVLYLGMFIVSMGMSVISAFNYPGGFALAEFRKYNGTVHLDPFTCMNGASRFQESPYSTYYKNETLSVYDFDYLISHEPEKHTEYQAVNLGANYNAGYSNAACYAIWMGCEFGWFVNDHIASISTFYTVQSVSKDIKWMSTGSKVILGCSLIVGAVLRVLRNMCRFNCCILAQADTWISINVLLTEFILLFMLIYYLYRVYEKMPVKSDTIGMLIDNGLLRIVCLVPLGILEALDYYSEHLHNNGIPMRPSLLW
ncbi:dolichyl-P-Man:Man(7)GlcNAc(2)-PP-dolichol alpha-1,6-mannosyltransferase [Terramyces sp. JEL0728]|nr:dolichyl-P-Man:Man(7)GlcNAc(2)-PP-dolichol alpha-1,6-mannosyltransferase [Terramyces sp. JEL0728]